MKKQALGKGLKAFLPEDYGILKEERLTELDIDSLKPNPSQPRMTFDPESLEELAQSLRETGLLQPIIAVPEADHYKIIVGERRWRAAQKAGFKRIPAVIRNLSSEQQLEASLIENLQREDLNPIEIARAYQRLMEELKYTQQKIAEKIGKDRASVANYIRLLKLPKEIQDMLRQGRLSMGHARTLIALDDREDQISTARKTVEKNLSVREVENLVQKIKAGTREKHRPQDPDLLAMEEKFLRLLGTKVSISGGQDKGILKVYYYSLDELNRLYDIIKGVNQ